MRTIRRFNRVQGDVLHRRTRVLASVTAGVLAAIVGSRAAQAASANWSATATDGNWEATGAENNWSSGVAAFPGTHPPASPATSADIATFNAISNITSISINSATPNSDPLNIAGMTFTGVNLSSYTIGSTSGNSLVLTANAAQGTSTDQIAVSGGGRTGAGTAVTETINSPILLAAQSSGAGGNYSFQNNSTNVAGVGGLDALIFNGAISAGTMTSAASTASGNSYGSSLTLLGSNTNVNNSISGVISDGGAATFGGLAVFKNGTGTWTLAGNNTYTGLTTITGGILRITGNYTGGGAITVGTGGTISLLSGNQTFGNVNLATGGVAAGINVNTTGTATFGTIGLNGGNGFFTMTGGTAIVGQISENAASGSRHFDVNGGIVNMIADYGAIPGVLNLNGGTIRNDKSPAATLTIDSFQVNSAATHDINVGANGGTFDTTVGSITSLAPLLGTTATSTVNVTGGNTLLAATATTSTYVMSVQGTSTWDYNGAAGQVGGLSGAGTVTNSVAAALLTDNIAGTQTFSGNLGGGNAANVSFTKIGAGTQILSGTSSYTGNTTVSAGTLSVSGALANTNIAVNSTTTSAMIVTGSVPGATTVGSNGTLAGAGNGSTTGALGNVILAAGSTLLPGSTTADGSVGTITMASLDGTNGGVNTTGSTSAVRLDLVTPGASDLINVTGTATFSTAGSVFTLLGTPQAGTYTLVSAGTLAGTIPTMNFPSGTRSQFATDYGVTTAGLFTLTVTGNAANLIWNGANTGVWNVNGDHNWNNTTTPALNPDVFFNLDSVTFPDGAANESITLNTSVQPSSVTFTNATDPYSISGSGGITGSGTTLTKNGAATVILATNNTYGGNTNINAGTVQIGNGGITGTLGTGTTTLSNNAALVFNRSDSPTLSTPVNGVGSVEQMGPGTLIITSSNNWSGPTTIDATATLQLGNGTGTGNLGITSGVTDNGTLVFDRNNASSITAPINGNGSLSVVAGTLSLGANNGYLGTTTIAVGATLQVGTGSNTGSLGSGALTNNGTLAFNRSDTVTAPVLGGAGSLQQNGTGTLVLPGVNSYGGSTTVSNGTLVGLNPNAFGNTTAITISNVAGTVSFRGDTSTAFVHQSDNVTPYNVSLSGTGGTVDVNQATVAGTAAKTMTIDNIDASASTSGTFALTLTGGNSTGLTAGNIVGPTLASGTANVTINNNNTSGTTTIASYSQSATTSAVDAITFQGGGSTVMTGGYNPNIDGSISVQGGSLTILGSSFYSVGTTIGANPNNNNVTVAVGSDSALGTGAINFNDDPGTGTFMSADSNTRTILNPITNSSTNFTFGSATTGNLVFGSPGATIAWSKGQFLKNLIVNCSVMTINDVITNTSPGANQPLEKSGPGTLVLTNANTYDCGTVVFAGTLVAANGTNGSATGTGSGSGGGFDNNVDLNGGVLASDPVAGGTIANNVAAGSGAHIVAPGGIGSIGTFTIGGLISSNLTTLNFDVGSGAGPVITNGDLLTLNPTQSFNTVSVGAGTNITIAGNTVIGDDYRIIGDDSAGSVVDAIPLGNFTLGAAPSGQSYSLSTSVDPGFIDLVVGTGPSILTFTGSTANGTWDINNTTNWTAGSGATVYQDGDKVVFNDSNAGQYNITLTAGPGTATNPGSITPGSVTVTTASPNIYTFGGVGIAGAGTLTKNGTGTLVLNNVNTYSGATAINQGTVTVGVSGSISNTAVTVGNGTTAGVLNFAANTSATAGFLARSVAGLSISSTGTVTLANATASAGPTTNTNRTVLVTPTLSVATGGTLNLGSNDMIVHNGTLGTVSTAGSITNLVAAGRGANGLWTSAGINSSTVATAPGKLALAVELNNSGSGTYFSTFDGQTVTTTDVLVKYTYAGDADLSGTVTATDYTLIDNGFNSGGTLTGWRNGDFNYDGVINGDDYTLIDNAFNTQGTTSFAGISAGPAEMIASNTDQIAGASSSAVPEPTTLSVVGIGAASLLMRRRRRVSVTIV